ncbi:hypothetical protein [Oceanirhabdus sp. W0125-5]|uniref:hypothetical protein n=1 Tax=Oceanirhabdus sp. W0125-5 TaxID=2999116 RepID=UPI0022F2E4A2|nr:hypothetical protein [Oceanirhabdus sp. W0125-5]WBW97791.1 hypothetical protein OW730_03135 [Oceanirhabdus sp. W0125-5]
MLKIIEPNNFKEFSDKILEAEKNYFPMLGYKKMPFHDKILNIHKITDDSEKQNASFMTNHLRVIDYLENGEYCLYHLFSMKSNPSMLMTTMIIPSDFNNRYEIVEKSIKNILKWMHEETEYKTFKIQILEFGEVQIYPTLAYYLIPLLKKENFKPHYPLYLKSNTKTNLSTYTLNKNFNMKIGKENAFEDVLDFYYTNSFDHYYICDTAEELHELKDDPLFYESLITIRNSDDTIIASVFAGLDDDKLWIDNFVVANNYVNSYIGPYLLTEEMKFLKSKYEDNEIFIYTFREYSKSISQYNECGFMGFEYWVDFFYEIQ